MAPSAWIQRWAPLVTHGTVLDVACGSGRHANFFLSKNLNVVALDREPQQIPGARFIRADLEDGSEKHVAMENRLYPMRELLGDMLMEHGQPAAALAAYELSMKNAPNRLRGFYGASKAAEAAGDKKKSASYMQQLARLTRNADGDRAEIREAKQRIASR